MRVTLIVLVMLFVWIPATDALAFQNDPWGGGTDSCGEILPDEPCYVGGGGSSTTICTKPEGCPQCGFKWPTTQVICFVQFAAPGFCSCSPLGTYIDKAGNKHPQCKAGGSCVANRG